MLRLPVMVGFGGINTAGRSSFHHGYRRTVIDALPNEVADDTYRSLAALMKLALPEGGLDDSLRQYIRDHTLIRQIETELFDARHVPWNKRLPVRVEEGHRASFVTRQRNLPDVIPENWQLSELGGGEVRVDIAGQHEFLLSTQRVSPVQAAGQLPSGFDPGSLYPSRSHPRGLEMTIYAASDALGSVGIDWAQIAAQVPPDQISVYAGSAMGQLDNNGSGGMLGSRFDGRRVTSKHLPLGLAEMPADFINAYVLGNLGTTGTQVGACASFLYNLRQAISDIQEGRSRVVVVGNSEAPIVPDVIDGYAAMGALASDQALMALDGIADPAAIDYRRACRPFSDNCGFTLAESAQYVILMDDELAVSMGASIHAAITDVYVNADGHKKSISSPGVGNYITVAKAMAAARAMLGEQSLQQRSFIQAHGTSTPQNRVTESHILNELAKVFGIQRWPVAAIKAYLGHSLAVSSADQIIHSLGVWQHGIIPGIATIDHLADDVHHSHLQLDASHKQVGKDAIDAVIVNAKGFGGNNASGLMLAPHKVQQMLQKKHGRELMSQWQRKNEAVQQQAADYDQMASAGTTAPIYRFDHGVLAGEDLELAADEIRVPGYAEPISLNLRSPYSDLLKD